MWPANTFDQNHKVPRNIAHNDFVPDPCPCTVAQPALLPRTGAKKTIKSQQQQDWKSASFKLNILIEKHPRFVLVVWIWSELFRKYFSSALVNHTYCKEHQWVMMNLPWARNGAICGSLILKGTGRQYQLMLGDANVFNPEMYSATRRLIKQFIHKKQRQQRKFKEVKLHH